MDEDEVNYGVDNGCQNQVYDTPLPNRPFAVAFSRPWTSRSLLGHYLMKNHQRIISTMTMIAPQRSHLFIVLLPAGPGPAGAAGGGTGWSAGGVGCSTGGVGAGAPGGVVGPGASGGIFV